MSNTADPSRLKSFMQADDSRRESLFPIGKDGAISEVVLELEAIVGSDAALAAQAAESIASYAQPRGGEHFAARALRSGATANAYLGRFPEALEFTVNARNIARDAGDPVEAARALMAGMHPLCETGQIDRAIADGNQAREELLEAEEPLLAARVDLNLANVLKMRGEAEEAIEHLQRVLETLTPDDPIRPHALNALGECRFVIDDHAAADASFKEAVMLLGEDGGLATAIVTGNRADVAAREGRLQDALDLYGEARRRCMDLGAEGHAARLVIEAAEALESAGLHEEAKSEIEQALPTLLKNDMAFESARATLTLGRSSMRTSHFDDALKQLDSAARRFKALGNTRMANRAILGAVEASLALGRLDEAAVRLDYAHRDLSCPYDTTLHAVHQSALHEAEGRLDEALASVERAADLCEELGIRPLRVEVAARRSNLLRKTGASEEAIRIGREATEEIETIHGCFQSERLRAAYLASHLGAHEAYIAALLDSGGTQNLQSAFETVERARNRGLVERISRQLEGATPGRPDTPEIAELRRRLNALYASLANEGFEDQRRLRTNLRQREIDALEIELDRRLIELDAHDPVIDSPVTYEQVADSLAPGTAILEYFAAGSDLVRFCIIDGILTADVLTDATDIVDRLATELHFQCRRRLRGRTGPELDERMRRGCEAILGQLHQVVLDSLPGSIMHADRWLVIPHGPLGAVPFHALHDGTEYVIDRCIVSTAPSAAAAIRLGMAEARGDGTLVATVGDELAPAIRDEGDAVAALHRDRGSVTRLEDSEVTSSRLLSALGEARIAHIACHGRFLVNSPRSSGLKLSDRWLTVRDVHELQCTPSVVILSGCETGLHPREGADELLGLTRGFAAGGSRAVVASMWSVHDTASTRLMTSMHERLSMEPDMETGHVADALRHAQLDLRVGHPHPAYWAPFFCSECPAGTKLKTDPAVD